MSPLCFRLEKYIEIIFCLYIQCYNLTLNNLYLKWVLMKQVEHFFYLDLYVLPVLFGHPDIDDPCVLELIQDSKKLSERQIAKEFILESAVAWSVQFVSSKDDQTNILKATMAGMHRCIDENIYVKWKLIYC